MYNIDRVLYIANYQIERIEPTKKQEILKNNTNILYKFILSKEIEGCLNRTLNYYKDNINKRCIFNFILTSKKYWL